MESETGKRQRITPILYAGIVMAALTALAVGILKEGEGANAVLGPRFTPSLPQPLYYALTAIIYASVIVNLIIVVILSKGMRGERPNPQGGRWAMLIGLILFAIALTLMYRRGLSPPLPSPAANVRMEEKEGKVSSPQDGTTSTQDRMKKASPFLGGALFTWALLLSGGMSALGLWALLRNGARLGRGGPRETRDDILDEIEASLDDLYREADPRRAVIACYARLERVLRKHGLPRSPHLAPLEYMRDGLLILNVPEESTKGLTELFEVAKFSLHEIGEDDKAKAIGYLIDIKGYLEKHERYASFR
jgi:hypothetical protein